MLWIVFDDLRHSIIDELIICFGTEAIIIYINALNEEIIILPAAVTITVADRCSAGVTCTTPIIDQK
jgi:hypothetical protein